MLSVEGSSSCNGSHYVVPLIICFRLEQMSITNEAKENILLDYWDGYFLLICMPLHKAHNKREKE